MKTKLLPILLLCLGSIAHGQITLTLIDDGSDLKIVGAGTYQVSSTSNTTFTEGRIASGTHKVMSSLHSTYGHFNATLPPDPNLYIFTSSFSSIFTSIQSGSPFGFHATPGGPGTVYGPASFGVGTVLAPDSYMTFTGLGLSDVGLLAGQSGSFNIGGQQFNWSAVPEPSTYALISVGTLAVLFVMRRRFRK